MLEEDSQEQTHSNRPAPVPPDAAETAAGKLAAAEPVSERPGDGGRRRAIPWGLYTFLELAALCGMAVAQPLLDTLGRSPDFFIFHGASTLDVLLLVAAVTLLPAVVLWGISASARLAGSRAHRISHAILLGAVFALLAVQTGKALTPLRGWPLALVAALAGAALVAGYLRFRVPQQLLRVASVGPLVFVTLFVFGSASSAVVLHTGGSGLVTAAPPPGGSRPPVVILVLDEFPLMSLLDERGEIDARRYPNFADLAAGSTWYRNATAVSGTTTYAVPAMLTGRYPTDQPEAPHYSRYPENLFTLLGGAYPVQAWENVTQLCPPERCRGRPGEPRGGLPTMLRESAALFGKLANPTENLDDVTESFREPTLADEVAKGDQNPDFGPEFRMNRLGENQPARFTNFLDAVRAGPGPTPTLRFLHLLIPHAPWLYLPSGVRYEGVPEALPYDGQWWARLAHQRHREQVGYTDRLLGEALRALKETGQYDESLIVVTSDHGDSFTEGVSGRDMDDAQRAAPELAWVPLFVKAPGQSTGQVDDRNWEHVDLLPTIADHIGVEVPWRTDGISALGQPRATTAKRFDRAPGDTVTLDGAKHFAEVRRGSSARPVLPDIPELDLVGRAVTDFTVTDGGPTASLANRAEYQDVRPENGRLPALAYGWLPATVRPGTPVAIGLNGRIGAVVLAVPDQLDRMRFVGLITDETLFVSGENRLELFVITDGGTGLQRMSLSG